MELVLLFGPPAVGKMTVGRELCALTGWRLFHNHLAIEPLLQVFPYGTPSFHRLVAEFRLRVLEEALVSELPGLVSTFVWSLGSEADAAELETWVAPVLAAGGRVRFVELVAPLEVRQERNNTPLRLEAKASKRDRVFNDANLLEMERWVLDSERPQVSDATRALLARFPFLRVENGDLSPLEAAEVIAAWLGTL